MPAATPNLTVLDHPLVQHKVALLRDKRTNTRDFKELVAYTKKNAPGLDGFLFRSTRWTEPLEISSMTSNWKGSNPNTASPSSRCHSQRTVIPPVA